MENLILYHGSVNIIEHPIYGFGKEYNDYGTGFYCTEEIELAKEWGCSEDCDGYANKYSIDIDGLNILNLSSSEYNILHWITLLIEYRKFRLTTPVMERGADWLRRNYLIELTKYDIVKGYRADDSYFAFAKAFLSNDISIEQLSLAMKLGKLGEQYVLKSKRAFDRIQYISSEKADNETYYIKKKARDEEARASYRNELMQSGIDGTFIRDLVRNGE